MPAFVLSQDMQTLARYDVVAQHSVDGPHFVAHVALHNANSSRVSFNEEVDVVHMHPPLARDGSIRVHAAGRVPLTNEEIKEIGVWIDEIADEYRGASAHRGRQYIIHPPWEDVRDQNTGVRKYRRFSCAGFVLDAHLQVDIELLDIDEHALPELDKPALASAYPNDVGNPALLHRFGIQGDGPWRIVLAGYVLHALNRTSDEIRRAPYQAQPGNDRF